MNGTTPDTRKILVWNCDSLSNLLDSKRLIWLLQRTEVDTVILSVTTTKPTQCGATGFPALEDILRKYGFAEYRDQPSGDGGRHTVCASRTAFKFTQGFENKEPDNDKTLISARDFSCATLQAKELTLVNVFAPPALNTGHPNCRKRYQDRALFTRLLHQHVSGLKRRNPSVPVMITGNFGATISWTDTDKVSARVKDDRPECSEGERGKLRELFAKLDAEDSCMGSGFKPSLTRFDSAADRRHGKGLRTDFALRPRGKTSISNATVEHLDFVHGTQHLPLLVRLTLAEHSEKLRTRRRSVPALKHDASPERVKPRSRSIPPHTHAKKHSEPGANTSVTVLQEMSKTDTTRDSYRTAADWFARGGTLLEELDNTQLWPDTSPVDSDGARLENGETPSICTLLPFYNDRDAAKPETPIPPRVTDEKQSSRRRSATPIAQLTTKRARRSDQTQADTALLTPMTTPLVMGSYVPLVTAGMKEIRIQALVDSGADYSVVCEALLLRAFGRLWLDQNITQPENSPRFRLGDGQIASAIGLVQFPVELSGKEFQVHCWVFRQAAFDLILGAQFLKQHELDVLMSAGHLHRRRDNFSTFFCGSQQRGDIQTTYGCTRKLVAANDFVIKSGTEELVWANAVNENGKLAKAGTFGLVSSVQTRVEPDAIAAQGPTRLTRESQSRVLIANFTGNDKKIKRGTHLANLTIEQETNFATIPCASGDKAYRKDLQDAVDSATGARKRAEEDLTPMYFDQLGKPPQKPDLDSEGIPVGLDLSGTACNPQQLKRLKDILRKHAGGFAAVNGRPSLVRGYEFGIELMPDAKPVRHLPRRQMPGPAREKAVKETEAMIANGIVENSDSEYSANVIMVAKKNGEMRYCVDYRGLNKITRDMGFEMTRVDDIIHGVTGATVFTTLDLASGYWAVPMKEEDKHKTAFAAAGTGQHLQWRVCPFGLKCLPQFFQRMMNEILDARQKCVGTCKAGSQACSCERRALRHDICHVYLDDVIIFSRDMDQHFKDIDEVLKRMCGEYGLSLRTSKCKFAQAEVECLGHILTAGGVRPSPKKTEALSAIPFPKDKTAVKSFLGSCGFYRQYIKNFAAKAQPLNNLLRQDTTWPEVPTPDAVDSFNSLKAALLGDCILAHPEFNLPFQVETDASIHGLGACLLNKPAGGKGPGKVIQFASRSLGVHEKNYSQIELEALAVIWALSLFRHFLLGRSFNLVTDAKGLKHIFGEGANPKNSGRLSRWALRLQEYTFSVEHRPGKDCPHVDMASRYPSTSSEGPTIEPLYATVTALHAALFAQITTRRSNRTQGPAQLNADRKEVKSSRAPTSNANREEKEVKSSRAPTPNARREAERAEPQAPDTVQAELMQSKLRDLNRARPLENVTGVDLIPLFKSKYPGDRLAKHLLAKPREENQPTAANPIRYYVDAEGTIMYSPATTKAVPNRSTPLVYVPEALRQPILNVFHGLPLTGHLGFQKVWSLLRARFFWPRVKRDLTKWIKACLCCQRRKFPRNKKHGLSSPIPRTGTPFDTVHFDLVGPFEESSSGNKYILTAICPFTLFPFAIGVPDATAEATAKALSRTIFWQYGPPSQIASDRAPAFVGEVIQHLCSEFGLKHIKSSGYQPQGNCVERFHRFLNASLTIHCHEYRVEWDEALDPILFAYRVSTSNVTGYSPFFLVYGREATLSIDRILQRNPTPVSLDTYAAKLSSSLAVVYQKVVEQQLRAREHNRLYRDEKERRIPMNYEIGDAVLCWGPQTAGAPYLKSKLLYQWSKPLVVAEKVSSILYRLTGQKRSKTGPVTFTTPPMHVNRLRPYSPLDDGTPSILNQDGPLTSLWTRPSEPPAVGDLIIVKATVDDWQGKPFVLAETLKIYPASESEPMRFLAHWYGNISGNVRAQQKPGYIDKKDGKLIFLPKTRNSKYSDWTSNTTKQKLDMKDIVLVRPLVTAKGMLSSESLAQLEQCEELEWAKLSDKEKAFNIFDEN